MNITAEIGKELGITELLGKTPEIQFYANGNINQYQWRDSRLPETSDVWENESYDTRFELREAMKKHLKI